MPRSRFDPLGRRWVLLAPERADRGVPAVAAEARDPAPCDFCEGREHRTPPETFALRGPGSAPDSPGWRVRVVPNLFPATPVHEVVVHTPDHDARFEALPDAHRLAVLHTYASRTRAAFESARAVVPAFNRGREAGASRSHAHGQLFGLERVPPTLERESLAFAGGCVVCALRGEAAALAELDEAAVLVHPAPLVAHELLLVPPCRPRFEDARDGELTGLAAVLADALRRVGRVLGEGVATNVVVHTAPRDAARFHWHAHLYPRTAVWGALEVGAEVPIVAADPELTARMLRGT